MRVVDLSSILLYDSLPFARAIDMVLEVGSRSMGTPVEIEYALNLDEPGGVPALYLLQLKPLIRSEHKIEVDLEGVEGSDCFIVSERSMGNGRETAVRDVVWVDPATFDRSLTETIASEIEQLDRELGRSGAPLRPRRSGPLGHQGPLAGHTSRLLADRPLHE